MATQEPAAQPSTEEKQNHLYKVIVIGDYAVGKTSLIKRYTEGYFTPNYKLTIGVDFAVKVVEWDDKTTVSLQLWDVAGHEIWYVDRTSVTHYSGTMTSVYYKYAIAAIVVFDVSRPATFEAVLKWRDDVNSKVVLANEEPIPMILLANKCDLPGVTIDRDAIGKFARENGFIGWFETSAQDNINIDEAMKVLIAKVLEVAKTNAVIRPTDKSTFQLGVERDEERNEKENQNSCCNL